MNAKQKCICFFIVVIVGTFQPFHLAAQAPNEKTMVIHADDLFAKREYEQAYGYYNRLKDLHPENIVFLFRTGVCAIYIGDAEGSLTLIKSAYEKDPTIPDVNFFLGRTYLLNGLYDDALLQFNLQLAKEPDEIQKLRLDQYIVNCQSAKELAGKPTNNKVTNAGRPLNSPGDEFAPILFNNDSTVIFTYKGPESTGGKSYTFGKSDSAGIYHEDIFQSMLTRSGWFTPQGLSTNLNSVRHDAASALSPDGKILYIFRASDKDGGDIYMSRKAGNDWTSPVKLGGDINRPDSWEGSVTVTKDGHTMYFSSDRDGGFGGKDIYSATLIGDSTFGDVRNLGINVNTTLDDDAPYLGNNENTLYYSSRGHNSMGGYDIFFSTLSSDGKTWELAQTLGAPVNSTADDIFYQPSKDGTSAVFSSNRAGGNGLMDLYFATPGVPATDLVTLKGTVTLDEKPIAATVTVAYTNKTDIQGDYNTSSDNGKYTINLPEGENYKLYFLVSGMEDFQKTFDATEVKTYTTNEINVEFFSDEYKLAHPEKFGKMSVEDSVKVMQVKNSTTIDVKNNIRTVNDSSANFSIDEIPVDPGYYVVIGSFKNVDYAKRMKGKVELKSQYPKVQLVYNKKNGFTYVTVGHPPTLDDSILLAREARKEYSDAWIQNLR
ncbi:hypothetical protein BH09BAC5_BH09BAC5_19540 [soil metagenome]